MELNDAKLEILSDHYKHTYDLLYAHSKKRDRLFAGLLLLLILMLFHIYTPNVASKLVAQLITNKLGVETPINFLCIQSIIWFILLAVVIKYFQEVVYIERQYPYIHSLETMLNKYYGDNAFTREGHAYLKDYPAFLNWAAILYIILSPTILLLIVTSKIISEYIKNGIFEPLV